MPTVASLAEAVGGTVVGDATLEITGIADLGRAGPHDLSFLSNLKYRHAFAQTRAGAVLVPETVADAPCTQVVCQDPYLALAKVSPVVVPDTAPPPGVAPGAHVHPSAHIATTATIGVGAVIEAGATIGEGAVIGPQAYVGPQAQVGEKARLHPGAKVLERCQIGRRTILQAGAVVGSDGFGYAVDEQGRRHKIPQRGDVIVEDDCEIGANTTVDRATFGTTRIGAGTKLDNLVQIAHNVQLGQHCVVVSQSGIAGSTELGDRVIMGAQTGTVGHVKLASGVVLGARAGATKNLPRPGMYSGVPAIAHGDWRKATVAARSVPELRRRVRDLEQNLGRDAPPPSTEKTTPGK